MKNKCSFFVNTQRFTNNRWFPLVFIPIAFLFVLIYSYTTSPLFVHEGMDSCVFKTMGLAILQGKTPYVDFFDHKGPILYFINAFGELMIPGRLGIFSLQVIWLSASLFFLNKIARLFLRSDLSFIAVMLSLCFLAGVYQEGNQCEEWELLAISISFYFASRYILYQDSRLLAPSSFIFGLCFGYVFFIRPNDAVSQIGGVMAGILLLLVQRRDAKGIVKSLLAFVGAFALVSIPILFFFISRNAFHELMYGLIFHNALYSGGIKSLLLSCVGRSKLSLLLLIVPIVWMVIRTNYSSMLLIIVPIAVFTLILTGTNVFPHYYIVITPLILFFLVFLFSQRESIPAFISLTFLLCFSYFGPVNFIKSSETETVLRLKSIRNGDSIWKAFYEETSKLIDCIPSNERNDVWNYNLVWNKNPNFSILFHEGIVQCNRVPWYPMYLVNKELKESDNIELYRPKWVFVSHDADSEINKYGFQPDYDFIHSNYTLAGSADTLYYSIELYHINE